MLKNIRNEKKVVKEKNRRERTKKFKNHRSNLIYFLRRSAAERVF